MGFFCPLLRVWRPQTLLGRRIGLFSTFLVTLKGLKTACLHIRIKKRSNRGARHRQVEATLYRQTNNASWGRARALFFIEDTGHTREKGNNAISFFSHPFSYVFLGRLHLGRGGARVCVLPVGLDPMKKDGTRQRACIWAEGARQRRLTVPRTSHSANGAMSAIQASRRSVDAT